MFVLFSRSFRHFESLAFFENNFFKKCGYLIKKSNKKLRFLWKKVWLVGLFFGDKSDYIDMWMIKVTISLFYSPHFPFDMDVCFFQKDLHPIKIKTKLYGEKTFISKEEISGTTCPVASRKEIQLPFLIKSLSSICLVTTKTITNS